MATTSFLRDARMEFKTSSDTKALLVEAAELGGLDLTSFVLGTAVEKARQVIKDHQLVTLTRDGSLSREAAEALVRLLEAPPAPTAAMTRLMALKPFSERKDG
jgi:uncharacterized protein (DUF1778 family)